MAQNPYEAPKEPSGRLPKDTEARRGLRIVLILAVAGMLVLAALACTLLSLVSFTSYALTLLWLSTAVVLVFLAVWIVVANGPRDD